MVHLLLLDLPLTYQYRVVFMRRHLDEVVKSQDIMLERQGKDTGGVPEDRLKDVFRVQIHKVEQHIKERGDRFRFIEVDYNEVVSDPKPQVERVSSFLDGLDEEKMVAVVEPSLYRNRAST